MTQYKAGKDFAKLKNKHFGPHKTKALESGETIEITSPELLPSDVKKTLEEVIPKENKKTENKEAK